jgi:serine/threonine protein kinase
MSHLERSKTLDIALTRSLIAQLVVALESLHNLGWVHRNIRPENVVFTDDGYVRLVSFKSSHMKGSTSLCQAIDVDYCAPEVFTSPESYSEKVDIWSLGIITYEVLFGGPPFSDERRDRNKTIYRIINHHKYLWFPQHRSSEMSDAAALIRAILTSEGDRMSLNMIKSHRFFTSTDWNRLEPCVFDQRGG